MCGPPETSESLNHTRVACGTIMILSLLASVFSPKEYMHYILPAAAVFAPAFTPSDHLPSLVCLCMFSTVPHQRGICVCKCLKWDRGSLILYRCISHVSLQGQHRHCDNILNSAGRLPLARQTTEQFAVFIDRTSLQQGVNYASQNSKVLELQLSRGASFYL